MGKVIPYVADVGEVATLLAPIIIIEVKKEVWGRMV